MTEESAVPDQLTIEDQLIAGPHGDIPVRVYSPTTGLPSIAILWMHGGGFVHGSLDMPEGHWVASELAERASAMVVSVDYRLTVGSDGVDVDAANTYPVPLDDVAAAWTWLTGRVGATPTVIGGASAGANLALAAAMLVRDAAHGAAREHATTTQTPTPTPTPQTTTQTPAAVLLAYPTLHAVSPPTPDHVARALAELEPADRFSPESVLAMYSTYLGHRATANEGYATPGELDPAGLAPVMVITSEFDGLRPSGDTFADLAATAGVEVTTHLEPLTRHGHLNHPTGPGAVATIDRIVDWLGQTVV